MLVQMDVHRCIPNPHKKIPVK
ncbi:hypothetical protein MVLG_07250 [Microbotryum lychnidis-dioicae p1A1 Lamole]|uniref:Uncharacterized protein n=1 Tax=Microbotryum lychnidis-dioicae (strain p1A1 Lamole / MvSl-1064) TaxID=683840 RepID=U5HJS2_USTV1|nr:hypothetical protein MVLG_07250 [Microbotryum lychnidis-dioicae p1A1 Lamole]|eukprot:KDE02179.1 hypothetical protein MVLG_07250 [Microbotryum lychnidis-dioicae p1A1 Lamole]